MNDASGTVRRVLALATGASADSIPENANIDACGAEHSAIEGVRCHRNCRMNEEDTQHHELISGTIFAIVMPSITRALQRTPQHSPRQQSNDDDDHGFRQPGRAFGMSAVADLANITATAAPAVTGQQQHDACRFHERTERHLTYDRSAGQRNAAAGFGSTTAPAP
jgi:hypothetical protein